MNPECQKFESLLPDYRWLSPTERQPLDRHLATCAQCREELRQVRAVGEWFAQVRSPAPLGFADGVMAALARQPQRVRAERWVVPALVGLLAALMGAAATLQINPLTWWRTLAVAGSRFLGDWGAPVLDGWRNLLGDVPAAVATASQWPQQLNVALWGGALLVVVLFSWITLNHGRTERA